MKLRELTEVLPGWINLRIFDKDKIIGVNAKITDYQHFLKREILDAKVLTIGIDNPVANPNEFQYTLSVKIEKIG